jgi:hypothetical protein
MIEILGVSIAWETLGFAAAYVASEIIGASKLKENGTVALIKNLIDSTKPMRKEDEKVEAIKAKLDRLTEELKTLGK